MTAQTEEPTDAEIAATFAKNVTDANEINRKIGLASLFYGDDKPHENLTLTERMERLEDMFNSISETLEKKLDALLERIG